MAIYGAGSTWDKQKTEVKDKFFTEERFILGWDRYVQNEIINKITL